MTRCSCGRMNASGTTYCPACGKTVNHTLCLASTCGAKNDLDATFCRVCGGANLTEGARANSLWFLPPLVLLSVAGLGAGLLWASGLPQTVGSRVGIALCRAQHYVNEAVAVAVVSSLLYLCLPEAGRKAVDGLLRLWAKGVTVVFAVLAGLLKAVALLLRAFQGRINVPPKNKP